MTVDQSTTAKSAGTLHKYAIVVHSQVMSVRCRKQKQNFMAAYVLHMHLSLDTVFPYVKARASIYFLGSSSRRLFLPSVTQPVSNTSPDFLLDLFT